jgi:hypothetical protein
MPPPIPVCAASLGAGRRRSRPGAGSMLESSLKSPSVRHGLLRGPTQSARLFLLPKYFRTVGTRGRVRFRTFQLRLGSHCMGSENSPLNLGRYMQSKTIACSTASGMRSWGKVPSVSHNPRMPEAENRRRQKWTRERCIPTSRPMVQLSAPSPAMSTTRALFLTLAGSCSEAATVSRIKRSGGDTASGGVMRGMGELIVAFA